MIIYRITNTINGKAYIGLTTQRAEQRWSSHLHRSKYPKDNSIIHKALAKYGKDSFLFEVIDGANSFSELKYKEIHHIHNQKTLAPNGYNIDIGESKTILHLMKSSPIVGTSDYGEIVNLRRLKDVEQLGISPKTMSAMLSGKINYKKINGYYWEYVEKETIKNYGLRKNKRYVKVTTSDDIVKEFSMLKDAADFIGVLDNNLSTKLKLNNGKCEYHGFIVESKIGDL